MSSTEKTAPCPGNRQLTITLHELRSRLDEVRVERLLYDSARSFGLLTADDVLTELGLRSGEDDTDHRAWMAVEQWADQHAELLLLLGARIALAAVDGREVEPGEYEQSLVEVAAAWAPRARPWEGVREVVGGEMFDRLTRHQQLWAAMVVRAAVLGLLDDLEDLADLGTPQEVAQEAGRRLLAVQRG
jgi:hypothetical protein